MSLVSNYFKKQTTFLLSATQPRQYPNVSFPEIAFIGRSNVGKSSLINAIFMKKLAHISNTPGKTRQINFFNHGDSMMVVDLPGYGFAKSSFHKRKDWAPLLEEYFLKRKSLKAVVIFMDIRHPLKDSDRDMIALCNDSNAPFIPVLTKSDKMSNNQKNKALSQVNKNMMEVEAIMVSSKDITGFDKLSKEILKFSSA